MKSIQTLFLFLSLIFLCSLGMAREVSDSIKKGPPPQPSPSEPLSGAPSQEARNLFQEAIRLWGGGKKDLALETFEKSILTDRSILSEDDKGMGKALLKKYQQLADKENSSFDTLCRSGFLENVIEGNLEAAIRRYRQAETRSTTTQERMFARNEKDRLSLEMSYMAGWTSKHQATAHAMEEVEAREDLEKIKADEKASRLENLEEALQQLRERKIYLKAEERETKEALAIAQTRASRYHRYYYNYTGVATPAEENLGFINNPLTPTDPNPPNEADLQTPVDSPTPHTPDSDLSNYYVSRDRAGDLHRRLSQIRSELTGLEKREKNLEKELIRQRNLK